MSKEIKLGSEKPGAKKKKSESEGVRGGEGRGGLCQGTGLVDKLTSG